MKNIITLFAFCALVLSFGSYAQNSATIALFSPHQGKQAFSKLYKAVENSQKTVYGTIYSWSSKELDRYLYKAIKRGVQVKIVVHPKLYNQSPAIKKRIESLDRYGAQIKVADQQMHEKFFIIDGEFLVNSSANMSGGAQKRYSENFIFFQRNERLDSIFNQFNLEFKLLWDTAIDITLKGQNKAPALFNDFGQAQAREFKPANQDIALYSSSMNFKYTKTFKGSREYERGQWLKKKPIYASKGKLWTVKSKILASIKNAKSSILVNMNHFFLADVRRALVRAAKRGIEVKMVVDNQEYKNNINAKAETVRFVKEWQQIPANYGKEAPVRVKYYSHSPSPVFWHLNHHKYMLIDHDLGPEKAMLITGSYNLSITAEHFQYDSMVFIKGQENKNLFDSYAEEFDHLWSLNRDSNDKPHQWVIDQYFKRNSNKAYPLHLATSISLNWQEIANLRREVRLKIPGLMDKIYKYSNCLFYQPISRKYLECIELQ